MGRSDEEFETGAEYIGKTDGDLEIGKNLYGNNDFEKDQEFESRGKMKRL